MGRMANSLDLLHGCDNPRDRIFCAGNLVAYALQRRRGRRYVPVLSIGGLKLSLDWSAAEHVPVREVLIRREYAPSPEWLPEVGQTVVDVGANAGVFAIDAATRVGRGGHVIAIEPNPVPMSRLIENIGLNRVYETVRPVAVAIGAGTGIGTLEAPTSNSTIGHLAVVGERKSDVAVPVIGLDAVLGSLGVVDVDLLKVDVEGSELDVLESGPQILSRTKRVVVEAAPNRADAIAARLHEVGFRTSIRSAGPESVGCIIFGNRA